MPPRYVCEDDHDDAGDSAEDSEGDVDFVVIVDRGVMRSGRRWRYAGVRGGPWDIISSRAEEVAIEGWAYQSGSRRSKREVACRILGLVERGKDSLLGEKRSLVDSQERKSESIGVQPVKAPESGPSV